MRILLYGEANRVGSGAWCYAETLREMGHEVCVFTDASYLGKYAKGVLWRAYRHFARKLLNKDREAIVKDLLGLATLNKPDIAIILKGLLLSAQDVAALQDLNCWTVNINHDDFFSSNPNNWSAIQRDALSQYDYIFPTREVNVAEVRPYNKNVEFFPFAYYPKIHRPVPIPAEEKERWNVDVVFVGTWESRRCELLEHLVSCVPGDYAIYGSQWEKIGSESPLRPFIKMTELGPDEMAKAVGGARISLGFLRKENRDDYTQRTFEIPACGGVLLAERTERHRQWFEEGIDAEFFDQTRPEELCDKAALLLRDDERRERIRLKGMARVNSGAHTYRDRLQRLLDLSVKEKRPYT
jgi:spore maturation protein CgeB